MNQNKIENLEKKNEWGSRTPRKYTLSAVNFLCCFVKCSSLLDCAEAGDSKVRSCFHHSIGPLFKTYFLVIFLPCFMACFSSLHNALSLGYATLLGNSTLAGNSLSRSSSFARDAFPRGSSTTCCCHFFFSKIKKRKKIAE